MRRNEDVLSEYVRMGAGRETEALCTGVGTASRDPDSRSCKGEVGWLISAISISDDNVDISSVVVVVATAVQLVKRRRCYDSFAYYSQSLCINREIAQLCPAAV